MVNINTVVLAFQRITENPNGVGYLYSFDAEFRAFQKAWNGLIVDQLWMFGNGLKFYAIDYPVSLTLALAFSFYIYKKYPGAGLFKTMLFMPSLVSGLVFCIMYRYICQYCYQEIMCMVNGQEVTYDNMMQYTSLLYNPDTAFGCIIFYNIWISFGSNILLYSGAMSGIDESIVESAHLDGTNLLQEFWHISLPLIFPTFISLTITSITGVFTSNVGVLSLYGTNFTGAGEGIIKQVQTIGYRMYLLAQQLGLNGAQLTDEVKVKFNTSDLSAYGLIISAVVIPVVLTVRKLLKKYGPSVD
jgi:ABC-type sugar transport system permease subunit